MESSTSFPLLRALGVALAAASIQLVASHGGGGHDDDDAAASAHVNLRDKGLILTKIWCLIIAFVATFVSGVSPYFLRWNSRFLVLGTQFAGGVFLGTALMHFLSDSNETFRDRTNSAYPFAFMLATSGYLITLLADCVINVVYARNPNSGSRSTKADSEAGEKHSGDKTNVEHSNGAPAPSLADVPSIVKEASFGDSLLLILALCFHSVFEGIAIGVAGTEKDAWRNLWTICLHKLFAAIAMGIALLRILPNRPLLSTSLYAFAFAISTPVGVAIGIVIDSTVQGAAADWIYAISMGIACGVFIYVAVNHLLAKGFSSEQLSESPHWPIYNFLAVVLGATVIAVVMIWD